MISSVCSNTNDLLIFCSERDGKHASIIGIGREGIQSKLKFGDTSVPAD